MTEQQTNRPNTHTVFSQSPAIVFSYHDVLTTYNSDSGYERNIGSDLIIQDLLEEGVNVSVVSDQSAIEIINTLFGVGHPNHLTNALPDKGRLFSIVGLNGEECVNGRLGNISTDSSGSDVKTRDIWTAELSMFYREMNLFPGLISVRRIGTYGLLALELGFEKPQSARATYATDTREMVEAAIDQHHQDSPNRTRLVIQPTHAPHVVRIEPEGLKRMSTGLSTRLETIHRNDTMFVGSRDRDGILEKVLLKNFGGIQSIAVRGLSPNRHDSTPMRTHDVIDVTELMDLMKHVMAQLENRFNNTSSGLNALSI